MKEFYESFLKLMKWWKRLKWFVVIVISASTIIAIFQEDWKFVIFMPAFAVVHILGGDWAMRKINKAIKLDMKKAEEETAR